MIKENDPFALPPFLKENLKNLKQQRAAFYYPFNKSLMSY